MAKKKEVKSSSNFTFSDIGNLMDNMTKNIPFIIANEENENDIEFISTGIYILNAAISGSLFGGIQSNRITAFAGESGTGKSFIAYGCVKEAQKAGWNVIYIDTESSIQLNSLPNYGIDISPEIFKLVRITIVEDLIKFLTQIIQHLRAVKSSGGEIAKTMFVIDSVGMVASRKEIEDAVDGKESVDMTRQKKMTALFRIINNDLGYLNIPMICTNHTYKEIGLFPKDIMKNGNGLRYSASVISFLSKAKLKDGDMDDMDTGQTGITVTFKTDKNRLAKPKKVKFDISFVSGCNPYKGLDAFCRPEYFNDIGICKGKWEEYKTPIEKVDETTGEVTTTYGEFKPGGNKYYVRHLNKSFFESQLFTSKIFTLDILKKMDVHIQNYFKYKSIEELNEIQQEYDNIKEESDGFDSIDDLNLFE